MPLTPATPTISPAGTSIDTPSRRGAPSPANVRSRIESAAIAVGAGSRRLGVGSPTPASLGGSLPTSPVITAAAAVSAAAPIINAAMASGSRPAAGRVMTRRPRRSTVTRSAISITSCSLCEMNSTPMPVAVRRRIDANSRGDVLGHEHGRRLVEDEHATVVEQRLDDLDPLPLADRQWLDDGVGVVRRRRVGRLPTPPRSRAVRRSTGPYPTRVSITFSVTVIGPTSENSWVTIPTPARIASLGERRYTARPSTRSSPASGWLSP